MFYFQNTSVSSPIFYKPGWDAWDKKETPEIKKSPLRADLKLISRLTSQWRGIKCSGVVGEMGKRELRNSGKSNLNYLPVSYFIFIFDSRLSVILLFSFGAISLFWIIFTIILATISASFFEEKPEPFLKRDSGIIKIRPVIHKNCITSSWIRFPFYASTDYSKTTLKIMRSSIKNDNMIHFCTNHQF
jgi:hypothetical protein